MDHADPARSNGTLIDNKGKPLAGSPGRSDAEWMEERTREKAIRLQKGIEARMSPKGKLKLPPLLDKRRIEWGIIDSAFDTTCGYDRIHVWQIPETDKSETFIEGGRIITPETAKRRIDDEASRGVLVSAGLTALDNLRSHGFDLGHIVRFVRLAPWRIRIGSIEGMEMQVLVMRDGDLTASEDLTQALRRGQCEIKAIRDRKTGAQRHVYVDRKGKIWAPQMPWIADDY